MAKAKTVVVKKVAAVKAPTASKTATVKNVSKAPPPDDVKKNVVGLPAGVRTVFVNNRDEETTLDDDTARRLYENPASVQRVWDSGKQGWIETVKLRWKDNPLQTLDEFYAEPPKDEE